MNEPAALDRINVKRLVMYVTEQIREHLTLFESEPNDQVVRNQIASTVYRYAQYLQANRVIDNFKVVCDETNNSPSTINNILVCNVYIQPMRSLMYPGDIININTRIDVGVLTIDSSILTKEYHYVAYERAMSILEKK